VAALWLIRVHTPYGRTVLQANAPTMGGILWGWLVGLVGRLPQSSRSQKAARESCLRLAR
jgi:hypothetical protein